MGAVTLTVIVVVGAFFVRLVDIQVVRAAELSEESADFRTQTATLWAKRGEIHDRTGQALAHNADRYDVTASPMHVADFRRDGETVSVMTALAEIEAITGTPVAQMWAAVSEDPESNFTYLSKEVTTEQYRAWSTSISRGCISSATPSGSTRLAKSPATSPGLWAPMAPWRASN